MLRFIRVPQVDLDNVETKKETAVVEKKEHHHHHKSHSGDHGGILLS